MAVLDITKCARGDIRGRDVPPFGVDTNAHQCQNTVLVALFSDGKVKSGPSADGVCQPKVWP